CRAIEPGKPPRRRPKPHGPLHPHARNRPPTCTVAAQPRIRHAGRHQSRVLAPSASRLCHTRTQAVEEGLTGPRVRAKDSGPKIPGQEMGPGNPLLSHFHHLRLYEWGADLPGGTSLMASNMMSHSRAIVVAGIAIAAVGAGVGLLRSDLLLNRGFGNALEA